MIYPLSRFSFVGRFLGKVTECNKNSAPTVNNSLRVFWGGGIQESQLQNK